MPSVNQLLRDAKSELITTVQRESPCSKEKLEAVLDEWNTKWSALLPKNKDDLFMISQLLRAGRLSGPDIPTSNGLDVRSTFGKLIDSVSWLLPSVAAFVLTFALIVSIKLLDQRIWTALVVSAVVAVVIANLGKIRESLGMIACRFASLGLLSKGFLSTGFTLSAKTPVGGKEWSIAFLLQHDSAWIPFAYTCVGLIGVFLTWKWNS